MDEIGGYKVNIDDFFTDPKIWRTIVNGYPYNKFEELGLTYDEAYFATKQAIYSVYAKRDVNKLYRGTNKRGRNLVKAIAQLTDIGLNGTDKPPAANLTINTKGGFVEEGEYYSQSYTVNASVDIGSFNVTGTNGLPSGSFIADATGKSKTSFNGGEIFKVMIPKSKITSNINGTVNVSAKCKTYPVFYRKNYSF